MTDRFQVDRFLELFAHQRAGELIPNLETEVARLDVRGITLPVTVNEGGIKTNCYICNPIAGYTDYAIEETRNFLSQPYLRGALVALVRAAAPVVRASGLDRSVNVNNWLFSTNPAPPVDRSLAAAVREAILARHPNHAIIFRSLNTLSDRPALGAFQSEGFELLPSRQVYLFDGRANPALTKDMQRDRALLRNMPFDYVSDDGFSQGDYDRCEALYRLLYIEKYTPLNPQYTASFIRKMHQSGLIKLNGLRDTDGRLVAFGGRFRYGDTLTQPLLGYDTSRPQKDGLYRLISWTAQRDALDEGLLFNMSAGAASFKRNRAAVPAIEFSAVYTRHLPGRQRRSTRALASVLTRIGVPLMKRFQL